MILERNFNVIIPDNKQEAIKTVGDAVKIIETMGGVLPSKSKSSEKTTKEAPVTKTQLALWLVVSKQKNMNLDAMNHKLNKKR